MHKVISRRSDAAPRERSKRGRTGSAVRALYQQGREEERAVVTCTQRAPAREPRPPVERPCRVLRFPDRSLEAVDKKP